MTYARVAESRIVASKESLGGYISCQKMVSISWAASINSGIMRRSRSLSPLRSAVSRTGVYCASFRAMFGRPAVSSTAPASASSPPHAPVLSARIVAQDSMLRLMRSDCRESRLRQLDPSLDRDVGREPFDLHVDSGLQGFSPRQLAGLQCR